MSHQIGAAKPPAFYDDVVEHLRQIVDYLTATGDRANESTPRDGHELIQMATFDHLEHSMTASEDDVNLDDTSVVRLASDGAYDMTGIVALDGRRLLIINVSAFTITLKDEITSAAANQFKLGSDFALVAEAAVELWYDSVTTRWRKIS